MEYQIAVVLITLHTTRRGLTGFESELKGVLFLNGFVIQSPCNLFHIIRDTRHYPIGIDCTKLDGRDPPRGTNFIATFRNNRLIKSVNLQLSFIGENSFISIGR